MRLYATLAMTATAAALMFNFWQAYSKTVRPLVIDDMQPALANADNDLTPVLRHQARTAMLELQHRQPQF